jgi:hypothetical protein
MLEARAHRILPKGGVFTIKRLSSKGPQLLKWSIPVLDVLNPPFTALSAVENVVIGQYMRPLRKNFPTLDACLILRGSVFHPEGLALIVLQYTGSVAHVVNGSVLENIHEHFFQRLVAQGEFQQPAATTTTTTTKFGRVAKTTTTPASPITKEDKLPLFLIFGTIPSGIATEQKLTTKEGKPYDRKGDEPKLTQYSMIINDHRYLEIIRVSKTVPDSEIA